MRSYSNMMNMTRIYREVKRKFARLFKELNDHLEAAKVQGFVWKKLEYEFGEGKEKHTLKLSFDEITYNNTNK